MTYSRVKFSGQTIVSYKDIEREFELDEILDGGNKVTTKCGHVWELFDYSMRGAFHMVLWNKNGRRIMQDAVADFS